MFPRRARLRRERAPSGKTTLEQQQRTARHASARQETDKGPFIRIGCEKHHKRRNGAKNSEHALGDRLSK